MITYIKGDIFNSPAQVLVNTVNTVGVMGKGIALEFKNRYPEMYDLYKEKCDKKVFDIGNLLLWKKEKKWIMLFPTKRHWRSPSKISDIEEGLIKFSKSYHKLGIESIAFPKLGCGNGGLDWEEVRPLMEKYLKNLPIHIYIYLEKYKETRMEEKNLLHMEEWLKQNDETIGFTSLKKELQSTIQQDSTFLTQRGQLKDISWKEDVIHLFNGREIIIHEKELWDFWKYIRNVGLVDINNLPDRFVDYSSIMLDVFKRLDYVQPVLFVNNGSMDKTSNGYQYISS